MSKIGQQPVSIEQGVTVSIADNTVTVKGSKGEVVIALPKALGVAQENNAVVVTRKAEDKKTKALHGLYRSIIANAVHGVEKLWQKRLEIVGTGYNVKLQGEDLAFKVGYSHPVIYKKVVGIAFGVEGNNKVVVSGVDRHLVGQTAYQIKMLKKPDVYKGKGIRYEGERVRIKPGKKAKTA